ncbi:Vps52-domain-containing protein [Hesseltinella vesiculosa]|uniref:Vps52-domain-containing protein n=1 Tax=Hesseltinella vesiculosa TaxID=101127 RepID=A0A1X2GC58_9FUNG|nr:Vps52-domain-containing protein [Hesseltinella vesiculosa]
MSSRDGTTIKDLPSTPSNSEAITNGTTKRADPVKALDSLLDDTFPVQNDTLLPPSFEPDEGDIFGDISYDEVDDRILAFQEDEFVREALEKGVDLREYAREIGEQRVSLQRSLEKNYLDHMQTFLDLHNEIKACDEVLGSMEELLDVFQGDLGNISGEIQSLQERSSQMNIRLRNRKVVESRLTRVLQGMVIPPYVIKKISEDEVDEVWMQYVLGINKQMRFVKANQQKPIKALRNVGPEMERLRLKAAATIRDFFVSRIHGLCVPNTNIQIMQQSVFLKYKDLHYFVLERHHDAAEEIQQTYVNSLRWYFHNHFDRYAKGLAKLQTVTADKTDLIGAEEHTRKVGGLFSSSKVALKDKMNIFALGDRIDTLRMHGQGVILIHVAESKDMRYQFEQLFRSLNLTLIDNASSEYLFIYEFFSRDNAKADDIAKSNFQQIFEPTIKVANNFTKTYVENCYDAVGILLCIRINTQLALELQRRRIPTLEGYTNSTNMLLWPRFQALMTSHIESLRKMASTKAMNLVVKDIHPHYVTRRYAEFAASLLVLNDGYDDAILTNSIHKLRQEFEALLSRMASEFSDPLQKPAFLINNYDLIISVLEEAQSRTVETELEHLRQILNMHIGSFVVEQLKPFFGTMIEFVENHLDDPSAQVDEHRLEQICTHFNQQWRSSISAINVSVVQYFSNFKNGTAVLHAVLGHLIMWYTKFLTIMDAHPIPNVQPVGVQAVMVDIKRFRSTF